MLVCTYPVRTHTTTGLHTRSICVEFRPIFCSVCMCDAPIPSVFIWSFVSFSQARQKVCLLSHYTMHSTIQAMLYETLLRSLGMCAVCTYMLSHDPFLSTLYMYIFCVHNAHMPRFSSFMKLMMFAAATKLFFVHIHIAFFVFNLCPFLFHSLSLESR